MDNNQYPTGSPEPQNVFISPSAKFRVPTRAERFKPAPTSQRPSVAKLATSLPLLRNFHNGRAELDKLIAKDAAWREAKAG